MQSSLACKRAGRQSAGQCSLASKQAGRQVAGCAVASAESPVQQTDRQAGSRVFSCLGRVAWAANRQEGRQVAGCAVAWAE